MKTLLKLDTKFFYFINNKLQCKFLDMILPYVTHLAGVTATCIYGLLAIAFNRPLALNLIASLLLCQLLVQLGKRLFTRLRPCYAKSKTRIFQSHLLEDFSFPSGHTATAVTLAIVLSSHFAAMTPLFVILAILVAFSRMYLGLHYPTDVLMGAFIGIVSSIIGI